MQPPNNELALVSCSYAPDFHRCYRLCQSVDRWVSGEIAHRVIVPHKDLALFRPLENSRRSVLAVEDVVPAPFWQVPKTRRWWLDQFGWPVRGWIMQQVTKLSANNATCAEHIVFADSDLVFVRPFGRDNVILTPHLTFYTEQAMERLERETLERVRELVEGRPVSIKSPDPRLAGQENAIYPT